MAPEWPEALNCRKYPVYSPPRPKFHSVSLHDQPFSRCKVVENRKCTKWPPNDLNHLTIKSTLYTLNRNPEAHISLSFAPRPAVFEIQGCGKSEMHRMTPEWLNHLLKCQKYPVYTKYSPLTPKFHSVSFYVQSFRYSLVQNGKSPNDPRMTLST